MTILALLHRLLGETRRRTSNRPCWYWVGEVVTSNWNEALPLLHQPNVSTHGIHRPLVKQAIITRVCRIMSRSLDGLLHIGPTQQGTSMEPVSESIQVLWAKLGTRRGRDWQHDRVSKLMLLGRDYHIKARPCLFLDRTGTSLGRCRTCISCWCGCWLAESKGDSGWLLEEEICKHEISVKRLVQIAHTILHIAG